MQIGKFDGADFKYDNSLAPKYPNKTLLVANLGIFIISQHFEIRQIEGLAILNMKIVFLKIVVQKYPKKAFLVKNTQIRHFWSQI